MKKKLTAITIAIISIALVISCSKYDENSGISLKSKEARLCREWGLKKSIYQGIEDEFSKPVIFYTFKKDNSVEEKLETEYGYYIQDGTWKFTTNKEHIIMSFNREVYDTINYVVIDTSLVSTEYIIKKLTSKELKLSAVDINYETYYVYNKE